MIIGLATPLNSTPLSFIRLQAFSLVLLVSLIFSGCSVDMPSHTETTGNYIGPKTAAQIVTGKSQSFVEALIGEPTKKDKLSDNDEIWKYIYVEKHISNGSAFLVTGTAADAENTRTTFVEFKDGVVAQCWQD